MAQASHRVWTDFGGALPNGDVHGVSVYLPTWEATMGWVQRDPKVTDRMKTGYPRFFYHPLVTKLTARILSRVAGSGMLGSDGQKFACTLFPARVYAQQFGDYVGKDVTKALFLQGTNRRAKTQGSDQLPEVAAWEHLQLFAAVYPSTEENVTKAKQFWQHTGYGISSRYAELCLEHSKDWSIRPCSHDVLAKVESNSHSSENGPDSISSSFESLDSADSGYVSSGEIDGLVSLDEAGRCKDILRQRIADHGSSGDMKIAGSDVYLYSTGMCALTEVGHALRSTRESKTMAFFGFLYVDTFKTISRIQGWETILYGQASTSELDDFEAKLASGVKIAGVYGEMPGNPLLRTPDLRRLRRLADTYDFPVIIDDTVGTSVNVEILDFTDMICTSLTKMFSGGCNVMGGSLLLNPRSKYYQQLKTYIDTNYIDSYFPPDAIIMEGNSRDFSQRVRLSSTNAARVAGDLRQSPAVKHVYYPLGSGTQSLYDSFCRRPVENGSGSSDADPTEKDSYGFLLSIDFHQPQQAVAFFDNLDVAKGPSLGTNFTLSCPFTLYGHYQELEWAASYGVQEHLVRISVGLEDYATVLKPVVGEALRAAELATSTI